jgi:hypothetical protein
VGIVAGLTLKTTSLAVTSVLGIYGPDESDESGSTATGRRDSQASDYQYDPARLLDDGESTPESDTFWREAGGGSSTSSSKGAKGGKFLAPSLLLTSRRVPGRLLRETIHEEEDDDDDNDSL